MHLVASNGDPYHHVNGISFGHMCKVLAAESKWISIYIQYGIRQLKG